MKRDGNKSLRVGGYSVLVIMLCIAILAAANCLLRVLPEKYLQYDITPKQLYSLSEQTKSILSELNEDIKVYWVVRDGYQSDMIRLLLHEYEKESDHLLVEEIDPDVYPNFLKKYTGDEAKDNSLIIEKGNRFKYYDYYDIFVFVDDTEAAESIHFAGEDCITSGIDYAVNGENLLVVSLIGAGEDTISTEVQNRLEKENITVKQLTLTTANVIPSDAAMVMICNPKRDISSEEASIVMEYLETGGHLMLITSPEQENVRFDHIRRLMEYYGVVMTDGLVVEHDPAYYAWNAPYYLLPYIKAHDITNPLTQNGYFTLLPAASGLQASPVLRDGLTVSMLLTTSDTSISKMAGYNLTTYETEAGDIGGPFGLAAAVQNRINESETAKIIWIASSYILDESINQMVSGGNMDFFLNSVDWLVDKKESNLSVRHKNLNNEYLVMSTKTGTVFTILFMTVIPMAFLGIGLLVVLWRRRR